MINKIHKLFEPLRTVINPPIGEIFMLHRVDYRDQTKLFPNENMKISPQFLENFIQSRQERFQFVSLEDVFSILNNDKKIKKPFISLTLDDGYLDNYTYASPIFNKYKIPFTIFITTDFPDKQAFLWWYILEDIIIKNDNICLSTGEIFDCTTLSEKINAFMSIRKIILDFPCSCIKKGFIELLSGYKFNSDEYSSSLTLSWDQIIELSNSPLCTIGAHSITHSPLSKLSISELDKEIMGCKEKIESKIGNQVRHFAYPYGTYPEINDTVIQFVKNAGFKTASLADGGAIKKYDRNTCALSRVMLTEAM